MWGADAYKRPKSVSIPDVISRIVYPVPRSAYRPCATNFSAVRSDNEYRIYDTGLQFLLQSLFNSIDEVSKGKAKEQWPYYEVFLETVPAKYEDGCAPFDPEEADDDLSQEEIEKLKVNPDAAQYRLHVFTLRANIRVGEAMDKIIEQNAKLARDSAMRESNSRLKDPLQGLQAHQRACFVRGRTFYTRTICSAITRSNALMQDMESILDPSPANGLGANNPANPENVFTLDNAMKFEDEKCDPRFCDVNNYVRENHNGVEVHTFPSCSHIIRLFPEELMPRNFVCKLLPDYQQWYEQHEKNRRDSSQLSKDDVDIHRISDEYSETMKINKDFEGKSFLEFEEISDFSKLDMDSRRKFETDVAPYAKASQYHVYYKKYQNWVLKQFKSRCLDPDAAISEKAALIIKWGMNPDRPRAITTHRYHFNNLSVFASRLVYQMEIMEQLLLISTAHIPFYLIKEAQRDAYRRNFGLHLNVFQTGEGATSKSFIFNLMIKCCIPNSIDQLTYSTGKADAIDGNRNDCTTVCHEAPPGMFIMSKYNDNSQSAMFKEKLTSNVVSCKTWERDDTTGKRTNRVTKSECIGNWMGATNEPKDKVEEALETRFFWGNFEKLNRFNRGIDDCMAGERELGPASRALRRKFYEECQEEQWRVFLVEKAIWVNLIRDVNMDALNTILPEIKEKISKDTITQPGPRDWERVQIFCQEPPSSRPSNKCATSQEVHGTTNHSPWRPCSTSRSTWWSPRRWCSYLSLFADQFRSPFEHKILHAVVRQASKAPKYANPLEIDSAENQNFRYLKLPAAAVGPNDQLVSASRSGSHLYEQYPFAV